MSEQALGTVKLTSVRIAFPNVYEPGGQRGQEPRFGGQILIPEGDPRVNAVYQTILEVANDKWPGKGQAVVDALAAQNRVCLVKGDTKVSTKTGEPYEGFAGHWALSVGQSKDSPPIVQTSWGEEVTDANKAEVAKQESLIYSGAYVHVLAQIWAQDNQYGQRVNCKLELVMFDKVTSAEKGTALGGNRIDRATAVNAFADLVTQRPAEAQFGDAGHASGALPTEDPQPASNTPAPAPGGGLSDLIG